MAELKSLFAKAVALSKNHVVGTVIGVLAAKSIYVKAALAAVAAIAGTVTGVK